MLLLGYLANTSLYVAMLSFESVDIHRFNIGAI